MLFRVSCARCRLASLWTDEPAPFLATVCRRSGGCEAELRDESFADAWRQAMALDAPTPEAIVP